MTNDNLAKLESKTDSLLERVKASRFTWVILGAVAVAFLWLGAVMF